jgi:hypothetical protein
VIYEKLPVTVDKTEGTAMICKLFIICSFKGLLIFNLMAAKIKGPIDSSITWVELARAISLCCFGLTSNSTFTKPSFTLDNGMQLDTRKIERIFYHSVPTNLKNEF